MNKLPYKPKYELYNKTIVYRTHNMSYDET